LHITWPLDFTEQIQIDICEDKFRILIMKWALRPVEEFHSPSFKESHKHSIVNVTLTIRITVAQFVCADKRESV